MGGVGVGVGEGMGELYALTTRTTPCTKWDKQCEPFECFTDCGGTVSHMCCTTVTPNQLVRTKKNSPYLFILVVHHRYAKSAG